MFFFTLILGCIFMLVSCDSSQNRYVSFRSSRDGKWGMIGMDGKVLFEEEFKHCPTPVFNGMFFVKNGNDMWEMYKASDKPEKVGEEYIYLCKFTENVTPSVKKNERISLIDRHGEVKTILEKANGKEIVKCSEFNFGMAVIETEDGQRGVINTQGEVVVKPQYDEVYIISDELFQCSKRKESYTEHSFIKVNGSQKLSLKVGDDQKYARIGTSTSKYIPIATLSDGDLQWGIIDYDKEIVLKPTSKIRDISEINKDMFIFRNDEYKYGLMDIKGETLIRAKYDILTFGTNDILICNEDGKCDVIDIEGNKLTKDSYKEITRFLDGKHAIVALDDHSYGFINKNGEELKDIKIDICEIGYNSADLWVYSDFVDIDGIIADAMIDKYGVMGFGINMTPLQLIRNYNEKKDSDDDALSDKPQDNRRDNITLRKHYRGISSYFKLYYTRYMVEQEGDYYSSSYKWTKESPQYIRLSIEGDKVSDNSKVIYSKIASKVKSFGKTYKENSGALIVKIDEKCGWILVNAGESIVLQIVNDGSYKSEYIDRYATSGEKTREFAECEIDAVDSCACVDSCIF